MSARSTSGMEATLVTTDGIRTTPCDTTTYRGSGAHLPFVLSSCLDLRARFCARRGAQSKDGLHACQHGRGGYSPAGPAVGAPTHLPGAPAGTWRHDAPSDCAWAAWAIYLDGGSPPSGGTAGVEVYGNVLDASMAGGVFINVRSHPLPCHSRFGGASG